MQEGGKVRWLGLPRNHQRGTQLCLVLVPVVAHPVDVQLCGQGTKGIEDSRGGGLSRPKQGILQLKCVQCVQAISRGRPEVQTHAVQQQLVQVAPLERVKHRSVRQLSASYQAELAQQRAPAERHQRRVGEERTAVQVQVGELGARQRQQVCQPRVGELQRQGGASLGRPTPVPRTR